MGKAKEGYENLDETIRNLKLELNQMFGTLSCVVDLCEMMRMPNSEYVADAHNEAVRKLRGLLAQRNAK